MKQVFDICRRGFFRLDKSGKRALFAYVLSLVVTAGVDGWALLLVSKMLDRGLNEYASHSLSSEKSSMLLITALFVIRSVLAVLISWWATKKMSNQEVLIGSENFARIQSGPWEDKQGDQLSDLYTKVDRGPWALAQGILFYCATIIAETASAVVIFFILVFLQPITAVTAVGYFMFVAVLQHKLISVSSKNAGQLTLDKGNRVYDVLSDAFQLGKLLHVMQSKSLPEVLQRERNGYAQARSQSLFYESLPRYLMEASLAFGFVVIGGATYIFADSSRVISALALFAVAGFRLLPSINRIQGLILALYARIPLSLEALAVKPVLTSEKLEIKQQLESSEIRSKYMLELNEVSYRYPNSMKDSINKVTISFERGLLYAIVGPSGAGKTTFVDVCLGILKPTGGEVRELATGIRYAYVPQHTHLAGVSLEGNVALEWDDSFVDYDLARDVMGQALIENVFDGRLDQPGSPAMSGGQMQRIGISRALYRNPNFLVLDEATNALDAFTENEIVGLIEKLSTAMTVLVVAHRLSTVRNADKVIYFDEGEIKGIGTFTELQEQLPKFAEQVSLGLFMHGDEGPTLG